MDIGGRKPGPDASEVARQLKERIVSADYPLHSRLPSERELATSLQLPRAMLRHALRMLEDEGWIWRRVGVGTFVGCCPRMIGPDVESVAATTSLTEILEARAVVEPIVAGLAAKRAVHKDIAMIERYSSSADRVRTWAEWEKWDDLLHRAFAEASGNGLLISTIDQLLRIKTHARWTIKRAASFYPDLADRYGREHRSIISCVTAGDAEGAETAMRRHMLGLRLTIGRAVSADRKSAIRDDLSPARQVADVG